MIEDGVWNGLPTKCERGTAVVADAPEFPRYWARTEGLVGQRIPVCMVNMEGVNYGGGVIYLDDRETEGRFGYQVAKGNVRAGEYFVHITDGSFEPLVGGESQ